MRGLSKMLRRLITMLSASLFLVTFAGVAVAGQFDVAAAAGYSRNVATNLLRLRSFADQGHTASQYILATMYSTGEGVPRDYAEAAKWYRLVADKGYAQAQSSLGFIYQSGEGVPRNDAEAAKWFRLAADRGDVQGQIALAAA
jgi:uncharacterized protein